MSIKSKFILLLSFILWIIPSSILPQINLKKLPLNNYRPKNIYNVPHTNITKAKFPVIDIHSHPYAQSKKELKTWVKNMDDAGIQKTILLTYAHGSKFDSLVNFYSDYPERFELWCGFDYTNYEKPGYGPTAVKELERCYKMGKRSWFIVLQPSGFGNAY